ncbi:hypothetical protein ACFVRD_25160 [Streptomyces sp. NPDC057908]|uniref:hypothetical protein n=1 Tax=Streptomyces sp. NPDC057908 TaxID=3346276 RepID=UPI0036E21C7A
MPDSGDGPGGGSPDGGLATGLDGSLAAWGLLRGLRLRQADPVSACVHDPVQGRSVSSAMKPNTALKIHRATVTQADPH